MELCFAVVLSRSSLFYCTWLRKCERVQE